MRERRLPKRVLPQSETLWTKPRKLRTKQGAPARKANLIAGEALRQFNLKFLQLARENSEATFEFLTDIVNAKDIQAAAELWTKHAQRQQELWSRQAREMTNLGQTMASQSMDSVSQNVGQTLRAVKS